MSNVLITAGLLAQPGPAELYSALHALTPLIMLPAFAAQLAFPYEQEIGDDAEGYENFATVSSNALEGYGLAPHPSPVCEAATLSSVPSPECDYTLKLPGHVLKSECLLLLQQLDAAVVQTSC